MSIIADKPLVVASLEPFAGIKIIEQIGYKYCYREISDSGTQDDLILAYKFNQFTHKNQITTIPFQFKPLDKNIEEIVAQLDLNKENITAFLKEVENTEEVTLLLSLKENTKLPNSLTTAESASTKYMREKFRKYQSVLLLDKLEPQLKMRLKKNQKIIDSKIESKGEGIRVILKIEQQLTDSELAKLFEPLAELVTIKLLKRTPHYLFTNNGYSINF